MGKLEVGVGKTVLKNPLIAGAAEHLIEADGVRRALRAGVGAVVVKSTNETERGRDQLQRAEYMLLDDEWREIAWTPNVPSTAFIACRSGLTPQRFEAWLDQTAQLDREAKAADAYAIASLIVADLALWVKITGQSERVSDLAAAAFRAGGEAVVMAGRLPGRRDDALEELDTYLQRKGRLPISKIRIRYIMEHKYR
jgi:hypothetical protein